jgi:hypothetical protein
MDAQFGLCPIDIGPSYKEAVRERIEGTGQRHRGPTRFKYLAAEAGKEVAEALRDMVVMIAGEAAKRAIWG